VAVRSCCPYWRKWRATRSEVDATALSGGVMMKTILAVLLLAASLAEASAGQLPCAPPLGRSDDENCIRFREQQRRRVPPPTPRTDEAPSIPLPTEKPAPTWWDCTPPGSTGQWSGATRQGKRRHRDLTNLHRDCFSVRVLGSSKEWQRRTNVWREPTSPNRGSCDTNEAEQERLPIGRLEAGK
jgi:hypothetical protein